jgi:phage/plasmid-associated DNA primase
MAQEDEMSLPYLVFRTWREYYDSLCLAEQFLTIKEYDQAQEQMEQAEAFLRKAKEHLLQRGMSPDDACIRDIAAACLEYQAQISVDQVKAMLEQAGRRKAQAAELL